MAKAYKKSNVLPSITQSSSTIIWNIIAKNFRNDNYLAISNEIIIICGWDCCVAEWTLQLFLVKENLKCPPQYAPKCKRGYVYIENSSSGNGSNRKVLHTKTKKMQMGMGYSMRYR